MKRTVHSYFQVTVLAVLDKLRDAFNDVVSTVRFYKSECEMSLEMSYNVEQSGRDRCDGSELLNDAVSTDEILQGEIVNYPVSLNSSYLEKERRKKI